MSQNIVQVERIQRLTLSSDLMDNGSEDRARKMTLALGFLQDAQRLIEEQVGGLIRATYRGHGLDTVPLTADELVALRKLRA